MDEAYRTVEAVARDAYGRLVSYLAARAGDVTAAEDALGDAVVEALRTWPRDGVPGKPAAWLLTAARHRLVDHQRQDSVRAAGKRRLELAAQEAAAASAAPEFPDERLRLLFTCAHPAIDADVHTPLMLQTVLGLDAARIARAFLTSPKTMGQRLVRAKAKIRAAGIAFDMPEPSELPPRLEAVLEAVYAAYGAGWDDFTGVDPRLRDLTEEAVLLARLLVKLMPSEPEARGLLALMCYCEARRRARRDPSGEYIPISEQDAACWSAALLEEAERELSAAARHDRPGRFQLEAAIQSAYVQRARTGHPSREVIARLYDALVRRAPTLGALVSQAAAISEVRGPEAGLALLDRIPATEVTAYQPYWAVRAHLLKLSGRSAEAAAAFDRAIGLTEDDVVRRFLLARRG